MRFGTALAPDLGPLPGDPTIDHKRKPDRADPTQAPEQARVVSQHPTPLGPDEGPHAELRKNGQRRSSIADLRSGQILVNKPASRPISVRF